MNIGVPGSTGHDFSNKYDEEKEIITWFGKPNAHSGQPTFEKLLNGDLVPLFLLDGIIIQILNIWYWEIIKFEDC